MSEKTVYLTKQSPWFMPASLWGKLYAAWFIFFFIGTWAIVKKMFFAGNSIICYLPEPWFGVWLLCFATIGVMIVSYLFHFKPVAEKIDERIEQLDKNEG